MKLSVPKLNISEQEGFTVNDIFTRKDFGERLASLVEQSDGEIVIALDAKWGEGKSTFIKMWQGHVSYQRGNKIKTIYFDAFANDYQKDPFLALIAEIYEQLADDSTEKQNKFKEKAGNVAKSMFRGAMKIGVRSLSAGLLDGSVVDSTEQSLSELLSDQVDGIIADKLENTSQDKQAILEFKNYLEELADEAEQPIVFIIDELDRCRPDFALELIEQIKHLFSVPGITFLLVLNKEQLEEAVRTRYGQGIKASLYLQKFVGLWLSLPRKSDQYHDDGKAYVLHTINSMIIDNESFKNSDAINLLKELVLYLKPSFREIEQILSYFALIHNLNKSNKYNSFYQDIFAFICYIKVSKPELFSQIANKNITSASIINNAGLANCSNNDDTPYLDHLTKLITFDLADREEQNKMIDNQQIHRGQYGRVSSNLIKNVCSWLSDMHIN